MGRIVCQRQRRLVVGRRSLYKLFAIGGYYC
jgi:hypothetical protein